MKVGDFVRVKSGVDVWEGPANDIGLPIMGMIGQPLELIYTQPSGRLLVRRGSKDDNIGPEHLEPWNDNEEWKDGKWVEKDKWEERKISSYLVLSKSGTSPLVYGDSFSEAAEQCDKMAKECCKKFKVFQEVYESADPSEAERFVKDFKAKKIGADLPAESWATVESENVVNIKVVLNGEPF